jgi:signal transduction histidine kinase
MPAPADAAARLPWLAPAAASLAALARAAPGLWSQVGADPGLTLLCLRASATDSPCFPGCLLEPDVLDGAVRHLSAPPSGFADWCRPGLEKIYQYALEYARLANTLAGRVGRCPPEDAWVGGLLAPLGWLAIAAVDPDKVQRCLHDPYLDRQPVTVQQSWWGLDQSALARRLCRRWRLPARFTAVCGHLGLPLGVARGLGVDPNLFLTVQLAVALAQKQQPGLCLAVGGTVPELASALGIPLAELRSLREEPAPPINAPNTWQQPWDVPLLPDLLKLAADNRRLTGKASLDRLEGELDTLHQALTEQHTREAQRLHLHKLTSLAELAAGAGHEINNPLAVISGRAQYLLGHHLEWFTPQAEPNVRQSLQTIINQAQRIHHVLTDLMQFAKPHKPHRQLVDVGGLLRDVASSVHDVAERRQVRVRYQEPTSPVTLHADTEQIRTALRCLLRNAVEAASAEGWASVRVEADGEFVRFLVEDSGKGPNPVDVPHLFDPFFSGRQAGRGRGMGLPIAWRLAREHGGDLTLAEALAGPTCFTLCLPTASPSQVEPPAVEPLPEVAERNGHSPVSA